MILFSILRNHSISLHPSTNFNFFSWIFCWINFALFKWIYWIFAELNEELKKFIIIKSYLKSKNYPLKPYSPFSPSIQMSFQGKWQLAVWNVRRRRDAFTNSIYAFFHVISATIAPSWSLVIITFEQRSASQWRNASGVYGIQGSKDRPYCTEHRSVLDTET